MPTLISDLERVQRFAAFWKREPVDRPLVGTTISTFPSFRAVKRAAGPISPEDLDVEENLRELDEEWEAWRGAMGDALWSAFPIWAFPWHLAMAGCPVYRDEDNIWSMPAVDDWRQMEGVRFDPQNPWFRRLAEFTRAIVANAGGRYPAGVGPFLLGPADMLMQARGQERLAMDLYDAPGQVEALGRRCLALACDAMDAIFEIVPTLHGGYAGTSRYFWAPGKMVEGAEDISFMMSPALHARFVAPLHRGVGQRFPYHMVHLHSAQLHTVPGLLEIDEVAAIEITPDFGEDLRPQIALLRRILERKPLILHGVMTGEAMRDLLAALPARGLCLFARANSPEHGRALLAEAGY